MRKELEQNLMDDFPFIGDSLQPYGFEVMDGWFGLVHNMLSEIQEVDKDIKLVQIKQKFGRLRVYYRTSYEQVDIIVDKYETLSETTCEMCGKPGTYRKGHMITLCNECFLK